MQVTVAYRIVITPTGVVDMAEFAATIAARLPDATITEETDHVVVECSIQAEL